MDAGAVWQESAQATYARAVAHTSEFEDDVRKRAMARLRRRLANVEMAEATASAVRAISELGSETFAVGQSGRHIALFCAGASLCESPIEVLMLAGLVCTAWLWSGGTVVRTPRSDVGHVTVTALGTEACIIEPQASMGPYRVDFRMALVRTQSTNGRLDGPTLRLSRRLMVVECDGHAFHQRTKDQVAHDRVRDRAIQRDLHGGVLLRYSGSEIWDDPCRCAAEAMAALWRLMDDVDTRPS